VFGVGSNQLTPHGKFLPSRLNIDPQFVVYLEIARANIKLPLLECRLLAYADFAFAMCNKYRFANTNQVSYRLV